MKSLGDLFNPRINNIGFIRFIAAIMVIFTHCFLLGNFDIKPLKIINELPGTIAVEIFFCLSGFLITSSYLKATSLIRYCWHRFLRIYPALWGCLIFTALIICPVVFFSQGYGDIREYLVNTDNNPLSYIYFNSINPRRQIGIGNVFGNNPWPTDLNGSLWTLWWEVICYAIIPILGVMGCFSRRKHFFLTLFSCIFIIYTLQITIPITTYWFSSLPYLALSTYNGISSWKAKRLVLYFMAGSLLFLYKDNINIDSKTIVYLAILATLLGFTVLPHDLICVFTLPYLILYLAINLPFQKFETSIKGDYSYGLYIYGYPIQQMLTSFHLNHYGFTIYFIISIFCTLSVAISSWHLIEKPFLSLKSLQFPINHKNAN